MKQNIFRFALIVFGLGIGILISTKASNITGLSTTGFWVTMAGLLIFSIALITARNSPPDFFITTLSLFVTGLGGGLWSNGLLPANTAGMAGGIVLAIGIIGIGFTAPKEESGPVDL